MATQKQGKEALSKRSKSLIFILGFFAGVIFYLMIR